MTDARYATCWCSNVPRDVIEREDGDRAPSRWPLDPARRLYEDPKLRAVGS